MAATFYSNRSSMRKKRPLGTSDHSPKTIEARNLMQGTRTDFKSIFYNLKTDAKEEKEDIEDGVEDISVKGKKKDIEDGEEDISVKGEKKDIEDGEEDQSPTIM